MNGMGTKKFLVLPAFYEGTSFEDITSSLLDCIQKSGLTVELIGLKKALPNTLISDLLEDNHFFHLQQQIISETIERVTPGSQILFLDFFFPGLDLLKYYFQSNTIKVKLGALLHGGTFLEGDLQENIHWLNKIEMGYFEIFDKIYVPSDHLKNLCPTQYGNKIITHPWGLDTFVPSISPIEKSFEVVFPHRIAKDKGIDQLIDIASSLPEIPFYITVPQKNEDHISQDMRIKLKQIKNISFIFNQDTSEHIKTLASSQIVLSCARQENFGYAIHKAIISGCIPVLSSGVCYSDFVNDEYIYQTTDQAIEMIKNYLTHRSRIPINEIYKSSSSFTFMPLINSFYAR